MVIIFSKHACHGWRMKVTLFKHLLLFRHSFRGGDLGARIYSDITHPEVGHLPREGEKKRKKITAGK